jgi:hypothetical protein
MRPRWIVSLCILLALGGVVSVILRASVKTLSAASIEKPSPTKKWMLPRTAWGDPDLTGVYSNDDQSGIPLERPRELGERTIEDITPEQLAEVNRQRVTRFDATLAGFGSTLFVGSLERNNSREWLVVDPPDGRMPPLTSEAVERQEHPTRRSVNRDEGPFDGYEDLGLYERCITRGIPNSMMPVIYGGNYEIIQSRDQVAIRYEMIHEVRVIPLDSRSHVGKNLRLDLGDARGRWEGDTLVVETTNFASRSAFRGATEDLRLTERFTPTDQGHVEWRVTVNDSRTWTRPWSFAMTLTKKDESQRIYEYACHEGNYGLRNILTGARSADQARQER